MNFAHIIFTGSIWYWLATFSNDSALVLSTVILGHGKTQSMKKENKTIAYCHMMSVLQSKINALVMLRLSGLKVNKNAMFSPILLFTACV